MKRFGLSKHERIKSEKDFKLLYTSGRVLFSGDRKLKAHYYIESGSQSAASHRPVVKIAPAVSRKAGNAVWRNRLKRLIKESYRLNKEVLTEISADKKLTLLIVFSPVSINGKNLKKPELKDIMPAVLSILDRVRSSAG